jgi:hypothetical protein
MTEDGPRLRLVDQSFKDLSQSLDDNAALKGGDGDGTSGDMEARLTRLEKSFDTLTKDVSDMRVDVATLKENVRHLPTKPWMFSTLVAMLAALSVIIGLIVRFIPHAP